MTKEEQTVFEYELYKLSLEYQKCMDDYLKSQIQQDISFLSSVLQGTQKRESQSRSTYY